jgi:transposase
MVSMGAILCWEATRSMCNGQNDRLFLAAVVWIARTGGEAADRTQAQALIDGFEASAIVADKGYDADAFVISITSQNAEAVIPGRGNRIIEREYDHHVYEDRNFVERFFNRIKQFRRLATRCEKLARRCMAMRHLVFAFIELP